MTCKLLAGDKALLEQEYYSPGGGFYEWKGYTPPKKGAPKYPYATMKELRQHAEKNKLSIAQVVMANELAVSGKTEEQINAVPRQDHRGDARDREGGPRCEGRSAARPDQVALEGSHCL
jgi:L-serine dehydratase